MSWYKRDKLNFRETTGGGGPDVVLVSEVAELLANLSGSDLLVLVAAVLELVLLIVLVAGFTAALEVADFIGFVCAHKILLLITKGNKQQKKGFIKRLIRFGNMFYNQYPFKRINLNV